MKRKLRIAQEATYEERNWWTWAVWLEGESDDLDSVVKVTYFLHPTFPQPERVVEDRGTKFRLRSSGWGEFLIRAEVKRSDGKATSLRHALKLPPATASARSTPRGAKEGAPRPKIFISYSTSDAGVVSQIRDALGEHVDLVSTEDVAAGSSVDEHVAQAIRSADKAIIVLPEHMSPWMAQELAFLDERGIESLPVRIHAKSPLPSGLRERTVIDLSGKSTQVGLQKLKEMFGVAQPRRKK